MGGDCLNVGCVPSKALISAARAVAAVRKAPEFGVDVPPGTQVDFGRVMERLRRLRAGISPNDSAARFRSLGVDVFLGSAAFTDDGTAVRVGDSLLKFKKAVITTGAHAAAPEIPGLSEAGYLTNETVFSLTELPNRMAIIGTGPIGCELAQAFARFGSRVSLFGRDEQILSREDPDAARIVEKSLIADGVELFTKTRVVEVKAASKEKTVAFEHKGAPHDRTVDAILVGVGRIPNIEGLNLEAAGVAFDRTGVKVDDHLRTSNPRIFAAGDVCFPHKFTHTADFLARIVIQNALFFGRARASSLTIPWCTYTSPEIAHVGLYEHEALERGIAVQTFEEELRDVDRAVLDGETDGFVKVHVKLGTDRILGATIVASHAGDLISEITVAMRNGVGLNGIGNTIHPYPTQAEAIRRLGDQFNRQRLTPIVKSILEKWLTWMR
jgi:pyruvate/2-oxoglutarate dehydrogenase complex dihydrolipoamide dehydrogenase (E3) component